MLQVNAFPKIKLNSLRKKCCALPDFKGFSGLNICKNNLWNSTWLIVLFLWVHSELLVKQDDDTGAFIWEKSFFRIWESVVGRGVSSYLYLQPKFLNSPCENGWQGTGPAGQRERVWECVWTGISSCAILGYGCWLKRRPQMNTHTHTRIYYCRHIQKLYSLANRAWTIILGHLTPVKFDSIHCRRSSDILNTNANVMQTIHT